MDKGKIQKFAVWARVELIRLVKRRAYLYEVTGDGCTLDISAAANGKALTPAERDQRAALVREVTAKGYEQAMEEAAYTWFNRFIALRFLEVNGYLPSHVRVFSDLEGRFRPELLAAALEVDLPGLDREYVADCIQGSRTEELYCYLLLTQCNALHEALPVMFERVENWTELLLPDGLLKEDGVLAELVGRIDEADWQDEEIIGWMYQYYISERHNEVVNINKSAVEKDDIPAATQLFTTDWVVKYMVDNSLGRYWIERHPESKLAEELDFFVKPKSGEITYIDDPVKPQEITFLDPCMGSGHILIYAFDVLMKIYRECGYRERDAVTEILEHNLFGLEIDLRSTQLAWFAVMMKARQYDRRIFTRTAKPQVYSPWGYEEGLEYGSLLTVDKLEPEPKATLSMYEDDAYNRWNFRRLLAQKYTIVCTNPPYMNKYNTKLKKFITDNYKDYSGDLFSAYMYRNFELCKPGGYCGFMTPFVWMFIKTYEKLRWYILNNKAITTLIQMEYSAFEEATVPICSFVLQNQKATQPALCFRLSDFKGGMKVQKEKVLEALANPQCGYFYEAQQDNFAKIPGAPVAYWVSERMLETFNNKTIYLDSELTFRQGMTTTDNEKYLRRWYEVRINNIGFGINNRDDSIKSNCTWFPYQKGGDFRKWYGNNEYVVFYYNDGEELIELVSKKYPRITDPEFIIKNRNWYFREGFTWSTLTSGNIGVRYCPGGFIFDAKGSMAFSRSEKSIMNYISLLNSCVSEKYLEILAPTLDFNIISLKAIPYLENANNNIGNLTCSCVEIEKMDWDSFETSWDFVRHPLI